MSEKKTVTVTSCQVMCSVCVVFLLALSAVGGFFITAEYRKPTAQLTEMSADNWTVEGMNMSGIDLKPSLTLEDCRETTLETAAYIRSELCSSDLDNWKYAEFQSAEMALYGGMSQVEYHESLLDKVWSLSRRAAYWHVKNMTSLNPFPCPGANCNFEIATHEFTLDFLDKEQALVQRAQKDVLDRLSTEQERAINRTRDIDSNLQDVRDNLTILAANLQGLGQLSALYARLTSGMERAVKCTADLAALYEKMLLEGESSGFDPGKLVDPGHKGFGPSDGEAILKRCEHLLNYALVQEMQEAEGVGAGIGPQASVSRRLGHNDDMIAQDNAFWSVTYEDCFRHHAQVQPAYDCTSNCCPPNSSYGGSTCKGKLHSNPPGVLNEMGDRVIKECKAFHLIAGWNMLIWEGERIQKQGAQLTAILATLDTNVKYAAEATSACSGDAQKVLKAYEVNAASLVKVHHCQRLVAEVFRRVAEECLSAQRMVLVPFYGLCFLGMSCVGFFRALMGIASTVIVAVLFCIVVYLGSFISKCLPSRRARKQDME